jgi:D-alanyl-lipoteichoic acid acyltransferase DltB (MBOAT superfamily)
MNEFLSKLDIKVTKLKLYLSTLITFTLIGLWHGANWTFVIFGTIHGVYLVTELLTKNIRGWLVKNTYIERLPKLHHTFQMSVVFILVSMSFIFFRSNSLNQAIYIFKKIISGFSLKEINYLDTNGFAILSFSILLLFLAEYAIFQKYSMDDIYNMRRGTVLCLLLVVSSILLVFSFGWWGGTSFIYFQF